MTRGLPFGNGQKIYSAYSKHRLRFGVVFSLVLPLFDKIVSTSTSRLEMCQKSNRIYSPDSKMTPQFQCKTSHCYLLLVDGSVHYLSRRFRTLIFLPYSTERWWSNSRCTVPVHFITPTGRPAIIYINRCLRVRLTEHRLRQFIFARTLAIGNSLTISGELPSGTTPYVIGRITSQSQIWYQTQALW